jgi:hypothetical protein
MTTRRFVLYLVFEVLAVIVAMASFRYIGSRLMAGAFAGACFTAIGAWIFVSGLRLAPLRRSLSFYVGSIHLLAVAIPMMAVRFWNPTAPFSELNIWGLSGPAFHKLSTDVYFVLLASTIIDAIRAKLKPSRTEATASSSTN